MAGWAFDFFASISKAATAEILFSLLFALYWSMIVQVWLSAKSRLLAKLSCEMSSSLPGWPSTFATDIERSEASLIRLACAFGESTISNPLFLICRHKLGYQYLTIIKTSFIPS